MGEATRGRLSHEDRSRFGRSLNARGDVGRVAECDGSRIGCAHEPDPGAAGVDPDPHGEALDSPCLLDVARVLVHQLQNPQGGECSTLRVVLVCSGHAEVGADAVSLIRLHRPAVLLDRVAHDGHALADERLGLLRRETLAERGGSDDVGEDDRYGTHLVDKRSSALGGWSSARTE